MPVSDEEGHILLTADEAALFLRCSSAYVRRLVNIGKLKPRLVGRTRFYAADELRTYRRDHAQLGQRRTKHD
jgi:hypothetical protein